MSPHENRPFTAARSRVAVVVPVEEGDQPFLNRLLAELERPASVALDVVLADLTLDGDLADRFAGRRVVRGVPGSRGGAYLAALSATDAPFIAWQLAGGEVRAGRFALQAAALSGHADAEIATCDILVRDAIAQEGTEAGSGEGWIADGTDADADAPRTDRVVGVEGDVLPACFETTVMVRRDALRRISSDSFAPAEFAFVHAAKLAGRTVHVPEPLAAVPADLYREREARTAQDARLVELAKTPHEGAPEVTVLLATHNRRDVFLECLSGFSRQLVPPGFIEIIAIDDGSLDGTGEVGPKLSLPVDFTYLRQDPADGASRARILGMPHATGRLILFVNDDTIPFPDTVQRHVEAHAALAPRKVTVLGTFEQPEEHLDNAFMRMLEESNHVFGYQGLEPDQVLPPAYFYTCHVSVELDAVRAVGGFDPDFSHYGCEDTDLGVRLDQAGTSIVYRPECRAIHDHFLPFDNIRRRQRLVAKAHVRLFEKFPEMLRDHAWWRDLTSEEITRRNAGVLPCLERIEDACRSLSAIDTKKLALGGVECRRTADRLYEVLNELFPKLNKVWWDLGFREGFEAHGIDGFPELQENAESNETAQEVHGA